MQTVGNISNNSTGLSLTNPPSISGLLNIKESSKQGGEISFVSNPGVWGTFHLFGQP